jgi:RNA polymerase sigma-70 factor (ECF subfamily)
MSAAPGQFNPTRWTLVLRAQGDSDAARKALGELCEAYWTPVFRFPRSEGRHEEIARQLTQDFFARVLAGPGFGGADPSRGRFRSYLLGALKHYLADARDYALRQKRGAGQEHVPLDGPAPGETSATVEVPDPTGPPADTMFDREWALTLMDRALKSLQTEFAAQKKEQQFAHLKDWLSGASPTRSQAEAAHELGLSEGALKVAIHRMRKRFRELIRAELAQTVDTEESIDAELRYLVEVLAR